MAMNSIEITWKGLFQPIPGLRTSCQNEVCVEREVIPIIFVPGIMGSRLIRASDKVKLWDPDDALFMLNKYGWLKDAARRRKELLIGAEFSPEYAAVSNDDAEHNKRFKSSTDRRRCERGWGGVMWDSYGALLVNLQNHRWPEPICHCFELPVHAFGYNWCASNDLSGEALSREIDRIIKYYQRGPEAQVGGPHPRLCNVVILVTHSMGGLVARSACMLHGAKDQVLGVVHGVQPATGSPAAYWRMKAGFERPQAGPNRTWWDLLRNPGKMVKHKIMGTVAAKILGTDGEEVTSLLGNMPGGLELLPTVDYVDNAGNREWLRYPGINTEVALPVKDPYEEIYLVQGSVYQMINPAWLDPQRTDKGLAPRLDSDEHASRGSWSNYKRYLRQAKRFHRKIGTRFHSETYHFYGTDLDSPDKVIFKRKAHAYTHPHVNHDPPLFNKGTYATYVDESDHMLPDGEGATCIVMMGMPDGQGDGTVPISSGNALKIEEVNVKMIGKEDASWFQIGHQDICSTTAAQNFIANSITRQLYKVIEKECGVCLEEG